MFDDPHSLIADRFLEKLGEAKPPTILAFGAPGSPHSSVGLAIAKVLVKTTFAILLRDYKYTLKPGQRTDYEQTPDHVPASGVLVDSFERRN